MAFISFHITLLCADIPKEYQTSDYHWEFLFKRTYKVTTGINNANKLKSDRRLRIQPNISYKLL